MPIYSVRTRIEVDEIYEVEADDETEAQEIACDMAWDDINCSGEVTTTIEGVEEIES